MRGGGAQSPLIKHMNFQSHLRSQPDGGIVDSKDAEILENDDPDIWAGPFAEYDKYGVPTGAKYYRCRDCGLEVHEDANRERADHRSNCRYEE